MKTVISAMALVALTIVAWGTTSPRADADSKTTAAKTASKPAKMNNVRLDALIRRIDKNAQGKDGFWQFTVAGRELAVVTDEDADRMRILSAVTELEGITADDLFRLMQANFDTALDARYAIAKGRVWSAFLHPLKSLSDEEFLAAIGQVVNLADTYGSSYSSGLLMFRGGDTEGMQRRELIDRLLKEGLAI